MTRVTRYSRLSSSYPEVDFRAKDKLLAIQPYKPVQMDVSELLEQREKMLGEGRDTGGRLVTSCYRNRSFPQPFILQNPWLFRVPARVERGAILPL